MARPVRAPGSASGNHCRRGVGEGPQHLSPELARCRIAVVEQVERGQRLRGELVLTRKGPVTLDGAQQHGPAAAVTSCVGGSGKLVEQRSQGFRL